MALTATIYNLDTELSDVDRGVYRASEIPVYEFGRGFIDAIAAVAPRRAAVAVSVTGRHLYLDLDGRTFDTAVVEHHFA